LYTSIPTKEVLDIITPMCDRNNTDITLSQEILNTYRTISQQNYFSHNDTLYIQNDSLAMGEPIWSFFLSEIYLQYLGNTKMFDILMQHKTIRYYSYVNDILMVYRNNTTNIQEVLHKFNDLTPHCSLLLKKNFKTK
jgi:predicted MPP superfamily phosphohydrolase